jgi:hypothetical protein
LLLAQTAASAFQAVVTMDSGVQYQQNVATLPLFVVVLYAASNDIEDLRRLIPRLLQVLGQSKPGTVVRIGLESSDRGESR